MPIIRPDGPGVDTKGSSNTKCVCLIHTHDRGAGNPSQPIDLSPYITAVSVSMHLSGGGSAVINLPAVDYIEDVIAAGDVVNIYFNTNRSNENIYNVGNVRTFFGYVDSITQNISVGTDGRKLTTYTINCKDFSKAIRYTEIYSNEHLASQSLGSAKNIVRKDIKSNLGGISLLSKGIALMGRPRKVVVQNLMRFIGFGGQWALPTSYKEVLPGSSHELKVTTGDSSRDTQTIKDIYGILKAGQIGQATETGKPTEEVLTNLAAAINELVDSGDYAESGISDAWNSVTPSEDGGIPPNLAQKIRDLKLEFKAERISAEVIPTDGDGLINNTFFRIAGVDASQYVNNMKTIKPTVFVSRELQGLYKDIITSLGNVLDEIGAIDPALIKELNATPQANLYAESLGDDYKSPVKTIFNILCLDYMEDVKGFWAKPSFMYFQGNLYNALQMGANSTMNELFFDLRPTPKFMVRGEDGLGVPMGGAMPMVPAVVLRLKPFTNYQIPGSGFGGELGSVVTGGFEKATAGSMPPMMRDQLVINSGGVLGSSGTAKIPPGGLNAGDVDKIETAVGTLQSVTETTPPSGGEGLVVDGVGETVPETNEEESFKEKIKTLFEQKVKVSTNLRASEPLQRMVRLSQAGGGSSIQSYVASVSANTPIARRAVSNYVTLPRPIFRSPDNNRITKELNISQTENILGVLKGNSDSDETDFFAFESADSGFLSAEEPFSGEAIAAALVEEGTSALGFSGTAETKAASEDPKDINWHVLDYMVIYNSDIKSESFTRGDFEVNNIVEYWGAAVGGVEHQRYFLGSVMPIITPISIYRFGVRPWTRSTEFIQAILTGGVGHNHQRNILLQWVILQDLWMQHNHELLGGTIHMRGMPGLRVGYRVDRPEKNLSMYVDQVSHSWNFPGEMSTSIGFSRGQPMGANNALPYAPPVSNKDPSNTDRQNLGKVFKTSEFKQEGVEYKLDIPGTFTGSKGIGRQIKVTTRSSPPKVPPTLDPEDG